jgi:hypothetical protein
MYNIENILNKIKTLDEILVTPNNIHIIKCRRSMCISDIIGTVDIINYKDFYGLVITLLKSHNFYKTNLDDIMLLKHVTETSYFMPASLKTYIKNFVPIEYSFSKLII